MSRRASRQFLDRSRFSIPDLTFLLGKISLILITIFICTYGNCQQFGTVFFGRIGILNGLERKKERRKLDWMDNSSRGTLLYAVLHFRGLRFTTLLWRPASAVTVDLWIHPPAVAFMSLTKYGIVITENIRYANICFYTPHIFDRRFSNFKFHCPPTFLFVYHLYHFRDC